ncbi:DUF1995 family protein [Prochlorococcus sp. MIT 1307]|uniref:DUF1995 family protein n=1 Tax=Prochlorococcus sp. MIT 1307 TaxID=3096219 RepID=UPI002A74FB51|nr:DUF1995 family protein [Prochlorococcus sp. MIT 1307]
MIQNLPGTLLEAEKQFYDSLFASLECNYSSRISIDLKLEGLRLMPVAFRLFKKLNTANIKPFLLWPDAGATALAKRDEPEISQYIKSFKEAFQKEFLDKSEKLLIAVSPQHYDYEEFEKLSNQYHGRIIMLNGKLDDAAIGIGSVARERRRLFISKWKNVYWLEPLSKGALMHVYPNTWNLYRQTSSGYLFKKSYDSKPNPDIIFESLIA